MKILVPLSLCLNLFIDIAYTDRQFEFDRHIRDDPGNDPGNNRTVQSTINCCLGELVVKDANLIKFVEAAKAAAIVEMDALQVIAKTEEAILKIPLVVVQVTTNVPATIAKLQWKLIKRCIGFAMKVKEMLSEFFNTIYENQAKALYGSISIVTDWYFKTRGWARICIKSCKPTCGDLPSIGIFGPCGGSWPCVRVTACKSDFCKTSAKRVCILMGGRDCSHCPANVVVQPNVPCGTSSKSTSTEAAAQPNQEDSCQKCFDSRGLTASRLSKYPKRMPDEDHMGPLTNSVEDPFVRRAAPIRYVGGEIR